MNTEPTRTTTPIPRSGPPPGARGAPEPSGDPFAALLGAEAEAWTAPAEGKKEKVSEEGPALAGVAETPVPSGAPVDPAATELAVAVVAPAAVVPDAVVAAAPTVAAPVMAEVAPAAEPVAPAPGLAEAPVVPETVGVSNEGDAVVGGAPAIAPEPADVVPAASAKAVVVQAPGDADSALAGPLVRDFAADSTAKAQTKTEESPPAAEVRAFAADSAAKSRTTTEGAVLERSTNAASPQAPAPQPRPEATPVPAQSQPQSLPTQPPAAQATPEPTPTAPQHVPGARLHQVFETVEATIAMAKTHGTTHARIALSPPELGGIDIRLRTTSAGVVATVIADSAEAVKLLDDTAADLRRQLDARGVELLRLDIRQHDHGQRRFATHDPRPAGGRSAEHRNNDPLTEASPRQVQLPNGVLVDVLA